MRKKKRREPKNPYRVPATCHVCGKEFLARYNTGSRAKVCTPPGHRCKRDVKEIVGRKPKIIHCIEGCCRSKYARASVASSMDGAIDKAKMLADQEFQRFMAETYKHDQYGVVLRFIAGTGCRLGEAFLVRPSDFQLEGDIPTVKIRTLKRIGHPSRTVDLSQTLASDARIALSGKPPENKPIFTMSPRTIQRIMSVIMALLGYSKHGCVHLLRHTRASQMIKAGASWNHVRQSLGWSSLQMAAIYVHTDDDARKAVLKKLS